MTLRYTLPFATSKFPAWLQFGFIAVGLLLLLWLIVWLYRYESRLIRPAAARLLMGLRVLVIGMLWLLTSLRPFFDRTLSETIPGRVLIALDRSDSMQLTDPQRPVLEKLQHAKKLKLVADICPDTQLDAWIATLQAGKPIDFRDPIGSSDTPQRVIYDAVIQRVDQTSREQIARRVLLEDGLGLVRKLADYHRLEVIGFAGDTGELPSKADDLASILNLPLQSVKSADSNSTGSISINANVTDLRQPLLRALRGGSTDQGKMMGLILLSDGQHNREESPIAKAYELGQRKIPVFPIVTGAAIPPSDIAVTAINAVSRPFKDVAVPIEVQVQVTNIPERQLEVVLEWPDKPGATKREPLTQTIDHKGNNRTYTVTFRPVMDEVGPLVMTVTAKPVPEDRFVVNNTRKVALSVAGDKAKALIIDGEARWEFHYLASLLARDKRIEMKSVVFQQPRLNKIAENDLEKMNWPARTLPTESEVWSAYDCVILGDVTPDQLTMEDRERIEKYVSDRGGTLVLLAGKRAMPMAYTASSADPTSSKPKDPIARLVPLKEPRVVTDDTGWSIGPSKEGERTWFLNMKDDQMENLARWKNLPAVRWAVVGEPIDGATPLAYLEGESNDPQEKPPAGKLGNALAGKDKPRNDAVIVRSKSGFGRVLYIGIDSTWRWRYKKGDEYHHRFWSQVITWAASDKILPAKNLTETIHFGTREVVYAQGKPVDFLVRLNENIRKPANDAVMRAVVYRKKDPSASGEEELVGRIPLKWNETNSLELGGQFRDLPQGSYSVELEIPELADQLIAAPGPDGKPGKLRAEFEVQPSDTSEMIELGTNLPLLKELAEKSGGKVFTPDQAEELLQLLAKQTATREYHTEIKLWQSWWTLAIFLMLLTIEWVVRKWAGLP